MFFKKIGFRGILGPPYNGISATIRIGREMLCLPYAGFFSAEGAEAVPIISFFIVVASIEKIELNAFLKIATKGSELWGRSVNKQTVDANYTLRTTLNTANYIV